MMRKKKAFTLIELLVVISIIALLVSILMPALAKARKQAKATVCQTNLRQLQLGMILYWNSNDDKLFLYGTGLYMDPIADQIDNVDEVRYCPETQPYKESFVQNSGGIWGTSKKPWLWVLSQDHEQGSYGFNGWLYGGQNQWIGGHNDYPFQNLNRVKFASEVPCLADCNWVDSWPSNTNVVNPNLDLSIGDRTGGTTQYAMGRFLVNRHDRKIDVAFVDGSVRSVPMEKLWTLRWHMGSVPNSNIVIP